MSAALKSYVPRPVPPQGRTGTAAIAPSSRHHTAPLPAERAPQVAPLVPLPTSPRPEAPGALVQVLSRLHLVSSVLAFCVVALTLVSYGTSVYISRQVNQATQKLNRLQRTEQQLTAANEVLKNYLAQQVQLGETDLQPPRPDSVIFLKPALRSAAIDAEPSPDGTALSRPGAGRFALPAVEVPLGY